MDTVLALLLLGVLAFLIPILYAVWIRNTEHCHRQRWMSIAVCFLWGASLAVIAALVLEVLFQISLSASLRDSLMVDWIMVIAVAPIVEEFAKPLVLGTRAVRSQLTELEDGLIYGAVAGLGFSATENFFYGLETISGGLVIFLILIGLRSVGACLLHASATALTGYGYGKKLLRGTSFLRILPYYAIAIGLHAFYNFAVSFSIEGLAIGLVVGFVVVIMAILWVRERITTLDERRCAENIPI